VKTPASFLTTLIRKEAHQYAGADEDRAAFIDKSPDAHP
jgi:hypothetical protein